jgi:arylformamidase
VLLHDITAPMRPDLPTWPDEPGLTRTVTARVEDGDPATVSVLRLGSHTGTHVDAPGHLVAGAAGVEALPLQALVGPALVVDLRHVEGSIRAADLEAALGGRPARIERVLARTRNSGWSAADTAFRRDYVAYDASAARWCIERGVLLLANDYLSIERFDAAEHGLPVHHMLLGAGVVILEGVDLDGVAAGAYDLAALPLLAPGSDGAPTRAVLRPA